MSSNKIQIVEQPFSPDLQAVLNELHRTDHEARQLVADLTDAQLNWQPGGGTAWSVAQCLDHLAQCNSLYTSALLAAVRSVKPGTAPRQGPIHPGWFARLFITALEPPPRLRIKAQKKVLPAKHWSATEVLRSFTAAHDGIRTLIKEGRGIDLNRVRFKNPFIRLFHFTVGAGIMIMCAHDRRHLWQARQVLEQLKTDPAQGGRR